MNKPKIISGGQTGVDQGALDFALHYGFRCGGYCPKGRKCEAGRIPDKYPLTELNDEKYEVRTRRNVQESDGTLIVKDQHQLKEGTLKTISFCKQFRKPYFVFDLTSEDALIKECREWLVINEIRILNVAGNRASDSPGIDHKTFLLLQKLFEL